MTEKPQGGLKEIWLLEFTQEHLHVQKMGNCLILNWLKLEVGQSSLRKVKYDFNEKFKVIPAKP